MGESTIGLGWMYRNLEAKLNFGWREGDVVWGGPPQLDIPRGRPDHGAAVEIAERFRRSFRPEDEISREVYIKIMGLECLTIVEGPPVEPPPGWPGGQVTGRHLSIWTKGLSSVLGSTFPTCLPSALLSSWLSQRQREWMARQPPGDPPRAVAIEIAPDEIAIEEYIKRAASCPDHWDALKWAASVLLRRRQPLGEALSDWVFGALNDEAKRPDARKAAKAPAMLLRDGAIIGAVRVLMDCGMRATGSGREPGPACSAVAEAFGLQAKTVLNIWKSR